MQLTRRCAPLSTRRQIEKSCGLERLSGRTALAGQLMRGVGRRGKFFQVVAQKNNMSYSRFLGLSVTLLASFRKVNHMSSKALSKNRFIVILITVAVIAGSLLGMVRIYGMNTDSAKALGLDIVFDLALYAVAFWFWIFFIRREWRQRSWKVRLLALVGLLFSVLLFALTIVQAWPRFPWIKAQAFTVADEFMTNLKDQDGAAALEKLTVGAPCVTESDLIQAAAQPASWNLTEMNKISDIVGTVTFSDGQEEPLLLRMDWAENRWQIDGVILGDRSKPRLDVDLVSFYCRER